MAAGELIQAQQAELVRTVSSHFALAARLADARQQDPPDQERRQPPDAPTRSAMSDRRQQPAPRGHQHFAPVMAPPAHQANGHRPRHHQDQPAKHEADSESASSSERDGSPRLSPDPGDKSRGAGPMGIFFKVWSLVKVTKSRHNRMKRQAGEPADPQQFQYVAGDQFGQQHLEGRQLAAGTSYSPPSMLPRGSFNQPAGARHLLQDGHFRRAGSQPPASSFAERRALYPDQPGGQLQAASGAQSAHSATGTASSSSGVSSTTSSTLATNCAAAAAAAAAAVAADEPQARADPPRGARQARNEPPASPVKPTGSQSGGRGWTARIKNRTSTAPPAPQPPVASQAARYRAQRAALDKRPSMQAAGDPAAPHADRQTRAQSEVKQLGELRKKAIAIAKSGSPAALIGGTKSKMSLQRFRQRPRQDSVSDHEAEGDEEADDDGAALADRQQPLEPDDDDDSDLNDIYSTPNDSIQSVPSGQVTFEQNGRQAAGASAHKRPSVGAPRSADLEGRKASQGSYQMTKSFSANYFSQLADPNGFGSKRPEPRLAGSTILEVEGGASRQPGANAARAHNSRFFISSSSSEDSNPPQAQSATTLTSGTLNGIHEHPEGQLAPRAQQQQVPVSSGRHYHGPQAAVKTASRPNSLAFSPSSQLLLLQPPHQPSVLTPNSFILNGAGNIEPTIFANVAAMSPMLAGTPDANPDIRQLKLPNCQLVTPVIPSGYKKSPSLFDMKSTATYQPTNIVQRFSSKYPWANRSQHQRPPMSSFVGLNAGQQRAPASRQTSLADSGFPDRKAGRAFVPHSISLHDCKLVGGRMTHAGQLSQADDDDDQNSTGKEPTDVSHQTPAYSEYKLAQMLLELGTNPSAKDETGCTALMHAVMSENLPAFKCLLEHGVDLNDTNHSGQSALDMICGGTASETLMEMLELMIDNRVDLDRARTDGSRLLDRLIREHHRPNNDKTPFIDCLLHNGAKLGSSTWTAARGKHELQLKLLKKLCRDGYFLYKKSSIEAAVFRFEYALKRIDELEQQVAAICHQSSCYAKCRETTLDSGEHHAVAKETKQAKYQTFLGLSRCERKRGFYKRALEFADMSILIDSTSYEGYYSKAHILKDIGEKEDAISTIDQTERLVNRSIDAVKEELSQLEVQEESLVFDGCFNMHDPNKSSWIESTRIELNSNLDYLIDAKRHISRLRDEIVHD